ncbi:MAG: class I SAM-dependent methyltransferase [Actinomycetota bacterium]|nr:class I SAM-dependent methyltransferase [Actinomycetota bacterium]
MQESGHQLPGRSHETATPPTRAREADLREWIATSQKRLDFWVSFVNGVRARDVGEIGVYRGTFAERLLRDCSTISSYYMVDPWRHLDDWNKPANKADDLFEQLFHEAMDKTSAYAAKRIVLRGKTTEVIHQVPDEGLDFAYIDGDHTLRGVTIDLVKLFPKVKSGGWIGGDDFCRTIWQHEEGYEPTLVFPFAVYFAEAVDARIYGLPYNQFLIEKAEGDGYEFIDLTGNYRELELRGQLMREGAPRMRTPGSDVVKRGRAGHAAGRRRSFVARLRRRLRRRLTT